jgi:hypothetical protein|tara:strand:- start:126 stop:317 length:192 start_codon:yes stop_codon:yes gene_type:complete
VLLYLESQLEKAYRVYVTKIPLGQTIPDIEFFREMIEEMNDPTYFEELLDEWERLDDNQRQTH